MTVIAQTLNLQPGVKKNNNNNKKIKALNLKCVSGTDTFSSAEFSGAPVPGPRVKVCVHHRNESYKPQQQMMGLS